MSDFVDLVKVAQALPGTGSVDYARSFGGGVLPGDPNAETPGERVFPPQGPALKHHNGYYLFRGFQGIPFRSRKEQAPDLKANDPLRPVITADVSVRVFDLAVQEDLQAYTSVWDQATKGLVVISQEDRQWVPESRNWKIFLRWGTRYWELPNE